MRTCEFCNIEKSEVIIEGDYSLAFYDKFPVNIGHTLVIPKKHIESYFDLSIQEKEDFQLFESDILDIFPQQDNYKEYRTNQ